MSVFPVEVSSGLGVWGFPGKHAAEFWLVFLFVVENWIGSGTFLGWWGKNNTLLTKWTEPWDCGISLSHVHTNTALLALLVEN